MDAALSIAEFGLNPRRQKEQLAQLAIGLRDKSAGAEKKLPTKTNIR